MYRRNMCPNGIWYGGWDRGTEWEMETKDLVRLTLEALLCTFSSLRNVYWATPANPSTKSFRNCSQDGRVYSALYTGLLLLFFHPTKSAIVVNIWCTFSLWSDWIACFPSVLQGCPGRKMGPDYSALCMLFISLTHMVANTFTWDQHISLFICLVTTIERFPLL